MPARRSICYQNQMIKRFLGRVFSGRIFKAAQPKIIPFSVHGIARESISPCALRVTQTLQRHEFSAFVVGGARWQTTGPPETVPQRLLRPVASTSGIQLYALSWDEPPYSRLYAAGPEGVLRLLARVQ